MIKPDRMMRFPGLVLGARIRGLEAYSRNSNNSLGLLELLECLQSEFKTQRKPTKKEKHCTSMNEPNTRPETAPTNTQVQPVKSEEIERQRKSMRLVSAIAEQIEPLTEVEIFDFMSFEEVIGTGWAGFVQVGLALGQIRERRLYREIYGTFDAYCRVRWQYGRHYVNRLISAAQVFNVLVTSCHQTRPEHEAQVRPLVGLTPEQARQAWEAALGKAAKRPITAAIVKSAMHELNIGPPPEPRQTATRIDMAEHRRKLDTTLGELLVLTSQKADHRLLIQKLEDLHSHIQALLPPAPAKKKGKSPSRLVSCRQNHQLLSNGGQGLWRSRGLSRVWSRESGQWAKAAGAGFPFPRSRFGVSK
jgi:hypothetical protein